MAQDAERNDEEHNTAPKVGEQPVQSEREGRGEQQNPLLTPQSLPEGPVHWIDFERNEVEDNGYTPTKDNVRGPYLPDQVDQVNRAARDDGFNTQGVGGLAEGSGTYGEVGAGTSGGTMGRGDTGHFGTMAGTDLSDTLGGPGAPDRTAGPQGTAPFGNLGEPEVQRKEGTEEGTEAGNQTEPKNQ